MCRFAVAVVSFALAMPAVVYGAKVDWLYNVDVPVADQSAAERGSAFRNALTTVLQRVTGLTEIPQTDTVKAALHDPQLYFVEYRYREDRVVGPDAVENRQLVLAVRFSEAAVLRLIGDARLPLWSSNRPTTVAWIGLAEGGTRSVLGADDTNELLAAMRARAVARGLPLVVPLMDLDEQLEVAPSVVWGGMVDVLEPASERYAADELLIGRVNHDPSGRWAAEWQLWQNGNERHFSISSNTAEEAGDAIVDRLADELVARYVVHSGDDQLLQVRVDGVADIEDYGALLGYLQGLEFIDTVRIDEVTRNMVLLSLATHTQSDRLRDLFALDGKLAPGTSQAPGVLSMTWQGTRAR
jgi:uncharacterized protein